MFSIKEMLPVSKPERQEINHQLKQQLECYNFLLIPAV
jgi:hypothetical protein